MQNRMSCAVLLLPALLVPGILFAQIAQTPGVVTNIRAISMDGTITVTWNPPADQNISYYRVYFSSQSILGHGGVYDDFEATPGPETKYVLQYKPANPALYISVLAVNNQGVEGEVFVEEAVVVTTQGRNADTPITPVLQQQSNPLPQQPAQTTPDTKTFNVATGIEQRTAEEENQQGNDGQTQALPEWEEPDLGGTLHLLLTDTISPTEVKLLFSSPPTVEPERAPTAFAITDADGNPLQIRSIYIDQETITVNTEVQVRDAEYELQLLEPLRGTDGSPLHEVNRRSSFRGHPDGKSKEETQNVSPEPQKQAEPIPVTPQIAGTSGIQNIRMAASSLLNGTYTVSARWDAANPLGDLAYYSIRQSLDGGITFSDPQLLPFAINGVDVPGVSPGNYGISVSAISIFGYATPEVFASILVGPQQLVPISQAPSSSPAPVSEPAPPEQEPTPQGEETVVPEPEEVIRTVETKSLSRSGAGVVLGSLGTMGMLMGWHRARHAKK
ncbi:MAG: hypothetical protein UY85_C0068G0002 [Candidatus Peribacteria bacterium GW2011_GWB1_54_5]|nr:MAG: hypothetical protein UY85_C0068G0002 [Candidatus Peribacteria bacterium GW2011_GWB1_54_5]